MADEVSAEAGETPADDLPLDESVTGATAVLSESVGVWDVTLTIVAFPGADPVETEGVSTSRLVAGRWLVTDLETDSGFDGHGVRGWDEVANAYVTTWVDSGGGGMARGHGRWDPSAQATTFEMAVDVPGRTVTYREVTEVIDADTQRYRNLMAGPDGNEYAVVTGHYRRRSS